MYIKSLRDILNTNAQTYKFGSGTYMYKHKYIRFSYKGGCPENYRSLILNISFDVYMIDHLQLNMLYIVYCVYLNHEVTKL